MSVQNINVATSNTTLVTVPITGNGTIYAVTTIVFNNPNSLNDDYIWMNVVKNGDTPSLTNQVMSNALMTPNNSLFFDTTKILLDEGDSIVVRSQSGFLNATVSYIQI